MKEIYLVAKYIDGTTVILEAWTSLEKARERVELMSVDAGFVDRTRKSSPFQVLATVLMEET